MANRVIFRDLRRRENSGARALVSLTLGIIGLVAWILPIAGLPMAIVGLVLGITAEPSKRGFAQIGIALNILGLILAVASVVFGAAFTWK